MNEELYFKDAFTEEDGNINLDINNLNANCITSKNNKFSLDSEGNLLVNSITTSTQNNNIDFDQIYPVGSIYFSVNNVNPGTLFGGIWERFANGRVLVGVDENQTEFSVVKKTGGSKYLQDHIHQISFFDSSVQQNKDKDVPINSNRYWSKNYIMTPYNLSNPIKKDGTLLNVGESGNLQPYLTCYIWTRIS